MSWVDLLENEVLNLWSLDMFGELIDLLEDGEFCLHTLFLLRCAR